MSGVTASWPLVGCVRIGVDPSGFGHGVGAGALCVTDTIDAVAECFCGCGVAVGGFASKSKSANKVGRVVVDALAALERDVRPGPDVSLDDPKVQAFKKSLAARWDEGERFSTYCKRVVRGDLAFGDVPWPAIRAWVRDVEGMTAFFRLPTERQQQIMRF